MGTLQVGGTTLGVKNTSTNKIDLSNAGDVNISGDITKDSLPMYACRAWVNFDGTKDTSGASSTSNTNRLIRGSGNVASVLRTGTGLYTITFTTGMGDGNYIMAGMSSNHNNFVSINNLSSTSGSEPSASSFQIRTCNHEGSAEDSAIVNVAIFR